MLKYLKNQFTSRKCHNKFLMKISDLYEYFSLDHNKIYIFYDLFVVLSDH